MKKYQKLYQLKQIVKAKADVSKYYRLTRKIEHSIIFDEKYKSAKLALETLKTKTALPRVDLRILHIAYSLLKGKKYSQIERSVKKQNELKEYQWKQIVDIMQLYKDEENTCIIPSNKFPETTVNMPKKKEVVE